MGFFESHAGCELGVDASEIKIFFKTMKEDLTQRKANINDLSVIVDLLRQDELGKMRETALEQCYIDAFHKIDQDLNQYLMVVEKDGEIIGTCHLTLMPSLTLRGSTRLQIEAVRISEKYRDQKIGKWMMFSAIDYGKSQGATIVQLTTNKLRPRAKSFYERLGFEASHEGMKLYLK
jgi:N-acetylglutamate synthase-like GNAT family acetyltransferase